MSKLKPYPKYKDSGVEWLGEIPEGWNLKKNKFIFKEKKETVGKKSDNYTLLSLTLNGVIHRDLDNPQGKFPAEFNSYKKVSPKDIIFCLFDIEETPRTVGRSFDTGMITGAYTVVHCNTGVNQDYIYYYYLSLDNEKRLEILYSGLRKTINKSQFFSIETPLPDKNEQDKIVAYLDKKTFIIDEYIKKLKKQIKLLKEYRQKIISQAVTCGLTKDGKLRKKPEWKEGESVPKGWQDSGVEWLGLVPKGWEVRKLKYVTRFKYGDSLSSSNRQDGDVPVYGSNGIVDYHNVSITKSPCIIIGRKGSYGKVNLSHNPCFPVKLAGLKPGASQRICV